MLTVSPAHVRDLLRSRGFWTLQFLGWLVVGGLAFGPWAAFVYDLQDAPMREVLGISFVCYLCSIALSSGVAVGFGQLPARLLSGTPLIASAVAASAMGGLVWTAAFDLAFGMTSYMPLDVLRWAKWLDFPLTTLLLLGWSTVFLLLAASREMQATREQLLQARAMAQEAHLGALRAKLNPHFLFNSLNSVIGLVDEDPARAKRMMRDVGALLRRGLRSQGTDLTTLREELAFLEQYLRCEQVRFGERLAVAVDVPEALRSRALPSLILQPLVENAIKHGVGHGERLAIRIAGREEGGRVRLEVRNTGSLTPRADARSRPDGGDGLALVRDRLRVRYGPSAELTLREEDGWVVASIAYAPEAEGGLGAARERGAAA